MPLCELHFISNAIKKSVGANVLLPSGGKPPFPVLYLLHGLTDDYTAWLRRSRIEVYAEAYPMVIVMPDGFRGWYTDGDDGKQYATYIGQELPELIERNFQVKTGRKARSIGGLSMGGYGSLRIGLASPDRFTSIHSHSGALMAGARHREQWKKDFEHLATFGKKPGGTNHDLLKLARQAGGNGSLPKIRIDCGRQDYLLDENREFHAKLEAMKIPHEYEEFDGGHEWDYWDLHVREQLKFHASALGIAK